ncbi:glucose-6-phosphate isomerase family protein [Nibricoccus sp. IMCC34717]|uniref:glucose-6-phosphate isomerase family protein n=1 Tax=Nibricoccus sp. IMCC34717 TaxID=3034021 RepID=UPI00384C9AF6
MTSLPPLESLLSRFDIASGVIAGAPRVERRLSDLKGCFADTAAYEAALAQGNPLLYTVAAVEPGTGEGDLHYGLGILMPGKIGDEYWMTKGHLHAWRPAAEFYIGLSGNGVMLLEDEEGREARMVPLEKNGVVYVPGHVAHRTMNTGTEPLAYLGVYPARAGHDYAVIAKRNFRHVIVERAGKPTLLPR